MTTATLAGTGASSPPLLILRTVTDRLARRMLTLAEVAPLVGYKREYLEDLVEESVLPIVRLPSTSDAPAYLQRRVPVAWIPRWLDMQDRRAPILTRAGEVGGRPGEPVYVSVALAAGSIGLTPMTVYSLIAKRRFCEVGDPRGRHARVKTAALDAWVFGLVTDAETRWYDRAQQEVRRAR